MSHLVYGGSLLTVGIAVGCFLVLGLSKLRAKVAAWWSKRVTLAQRVTALEQKLEAKAVAEAAAIIPKV